MHEDIKKAEKWARKFYKELGTKSPFFRAWFGDWRAYDNDLAIATPIGSKAELNKKNRTITNKDTNWNIQVTKDVFDDTLHYASKEKTYLERLLTNIDSVITNAILLDTTVSEKSTSNKKGSTHFMHYMYSLVEYNGNPFLAKIAVEEYGNDSNHRAYNVERIKMSALSRAQYSQMKSAYRGKFASNADGISIADLFSLVKQYDKKFNPKTVNKDFLNEGLKHERKDNIVDFARGEILIDVSGRKYLADAVVGFTKSGICELHDIVNMKYTSFEYKKRSYT